MYHFIRIIAATALVLALKTGSWVYAQDKVVIDHIVAVVGNNAILKSELIEQKINVEAQGINLGSDPYCILLDDLMYQKLLYNQAMIDSVEVSDSEIEMEIERRLRFFIQQIGSRERLEEYYGQTVDELREEFWDPIREQIISQRMEGRITRNLTITPSEVMAFFNSLSDDEIPIVESELSLAKIMIEPPVAAEEVDAVVERLEGYRQRILEGESFRTLAIMYSDDAGSARRGGELGFVRRGELHPEFEAVAFSLEPGEVSDIVETRSGYHIIKPIERRGEEVNVRHLLLRPRISPQVEEQTKNKLDSIRTAIMSEEISFREAAREFSDHRTARSGGIMVNPYTGTTRFKTDELDPNLFFVVDRLEVGEISRPMQTMTEDGDPAFQIVTVRERIEPHPANLQQDYDFIKQMALEKKKEEKVRRWVQSRLKSTYISVHEDYRDCHFDFNWLYHSQ